MSESANPKQFSQEEIRGTIKRLYGEYFYCPICTSPLDIEHPFLCDECGWPESHVDKSKTCDHCGSPFLGPENLCDECGFEDQEEYGDPNDSRNL